MKKKNILLIMLIAAWFFIPACGDTGQYEGDPVPQTDTSTDSGTSTTDPEDEFLTTSGYGDGYTDPIVVSGSPLDVYITHEVDSRIIVYFLDKATDRIIETIVYQDSVTQGKTRIPIESTGTYYFQIDCADNWTISVDGEVSVYADLSSCCPDVGVKVPTECDPETDRVVCEDGTLSETCTCGN